MTVANMYICDGLQHDAIPRTLAVKVHCIEVLLCLAVKFNKGIVWASCVCDSLLRLYTFTLLDDIMAGTIKMDLSHSQQNTDVNKTLLITIR